MDDGTHTCSACKQHGDCLARDGSRLCGVCLFERVQRERDDAEAALLELREWYQLPTTTPSLSPGAKRFLREIVERGLTAYRGAEGGRW